eukprot:jgi/Undpi1/13541/HiC_scaffold_8.g03200.m1
MASCENPEHAALESELNDALEEALQMEERLAAYEAAGAGMGDGGGGGGGVAAAKAAEEIAALTEQAAILEKERDTYEQDYLNKKDRVDELENLLEDKDQKTKDLDRLRRKLEGDLENTRKLLQTEKTKAADAQKRAGGADKTRRTEQRDQIKVLQELQDLRERAEDLEAQVKERDVLVEELVLSNQAQLERNETLTVQNEDLRGESNEVDELRAEKVIVAQLHEEIARAKDRTGAGGARERELEQLRTEVERLGVELLRQSTASEQAAMDREVLTEELELERRKNRDLPHEIRVAEAHKAEALEAKVKALSTELISEQERYRELEERKGRLEGDLQEAEDWKSRYEDGHGLVDAVQFQKRLKKDLHRLETELEERSLKMGEVLDINEVLTLTCQRLKEEAGRPQDFSYDDLAVVKQAQEGEVARLKAISAELQVQVDDLNDERVRLLKKLRDGAASAAVSSAATSEGVLGGGERGSGGQDPEAEQLMEAVKRLALEVERRDVQIEKLERSLLTLGGEDAMFAQAAGGAAATAAAAVPTAAAATGGGDVPRAPLASTRSSNNDAGTVDDLAPPINEEIDRLERENKSLREALTALSAGRGGSGNTATADGGDDSVREDAISEEKMLAEAKSKAAAELQQQAADDRVEQLTRVNETIMRKLQELMERRDTPREVARRGGRASASVAAAAAAAAAAVGGKGKESGSGKPAAVQADMQRLITEMGDLRRLVAGGFAKNNATATAATASSNNQTKPGTNAVYPRVSTGTKGGGSGDGGGGGGEGDSGNDATAWAVGGDHGGVSVEAEGARGVGVAGEAVAETKGGGGVGVPAPAEGTAEPFTRPRRTPQTVQGQEALRSRLRRLNLPAEDWAEEVRDVYAQLVETLEQLQAREMELDEHEELIARYETHLSDMRAQAATLYREHADREKEWEERRKAHATEVEGLREERDAFAIRSRRLEEVLDAEDSDDPTAPHRALRELSRKVTVYEVNEAVMARRYASIKDQLQMESEVKAACERDFLEMSTAGKTRVLYLEQWKAAASARLLRLQHRLDISVPEHEMVCTRRELEQLQGEFLCLLHSSAESRVKVAELSGLPGRVLSLEEDLAAVKVSLAASEEGLTQANLRAEKADALAKDAVSEASAQVAALGGGTSTQADFSRLLREVAKHQGDSAKAEVERASAARRAEIAERRFAALDGECRAAKERVVSLEAREREARQNAQAAAAELIKVQNRFEGGLSGDEARSLEEAIQTEKLRAESLILEAERHREIADIASEQALAINHQRKDAEEELSELRKAMSDLESRSDDDRLIGQLQRKLTATKVAALEGALIDLSEGRYATTAAAAAAPTGPDGAAGPDRPLTITRGREIATRVSELSAALEASEARLRTAEQSRRSAEMDLESAKESRRDLETLLADMKCLLGPTPIMATAGGSGSASGNGGRDGGSNSSGSGSAMDGDNISTTTTTTAAAAAAALGIGRGSSSSPPPPPAAAAASARASLDTAARRLLCLGEELRAAKLEASGLRRHADGLREDRRHLERKLKAAEAAARTLEEAKVEVETRALLSGNDYQRYDFGGGGDGAGRGEGGGDGEGGEGLGGSGGRGGDGGGGGGGGGSFATPGVKVGGGVSVSGVWGEEGMGGGAGSGARGLSGEEQRLLAAAVMPAEVDFGALDPEETLRRLQGAHAKAMSLARALAVAKAERDGAVVKAEGALRGEKDLKRALRIYRENEDSLGQLRVALRQLGAAGGLTGEGTEMNSRLIGQLEEVSGLLGEKDETIRQLEVKLRTATNQRERAEARCGETLEENARMRSDLEMLAAQVQDAEERSLAALEDRSGAKRLAELRKALLAKEKKMRGLREALVKLKQEFVQAEVDREAAAVAEERERRRRADDRSAGVDDKLKRLKEQLLTLQEGMAQAARDLEKERRDRDSATRAKVKVLEESAQLRAEAAKAEDRVGELEQRLTETRRDLDAAREKEERLRARMKTLSSRDSGGDRKTRTVRRGEGKDSSEAENDSTAEARGGYSDDNDHDHDSDNAAGGGGRGGGRGGGGGGKRRRLNELEKRVQVLTAQNAALRSIVPPPTLDRGVMEGKGSKQSLAARGPGRRLGSETAISAPATAAATAGARRTINQGLSTSAGGGGGGEDGGGGGGVGHREAAHRAWEAEKKLRRRVEALERRLDERGVELQAAEEQTAKAKVLLERATKDKEAALRRLREAGQGRNGGGGRAGTESAEAVEEFRSRVFSLEEENASLRRVAELELPREVESLKYQVRALRSQLQETDGQLEEAERRAKISVARALRGGDGDGGGGGDEGILRAEEGLYHDLEAARDELSAQKNARRELERQVLDSDAANMELRFDLEARAAEAERLRRRATELQAAVRVRGAGDSSGGAKGAAALRPPGGRFKRERDLEGVVDALKRVTEKLRSENERLRRAAGDGGARAEAERGAREAKKRAAALREEVERLDAKAKEADGAVLKLAQKQDLINQLRRKLKARDEDLRSFQERSEELEETKALLSAELEAANQRLIATDRDQRSKPTAAAAAAHAVKEAADAKKAAATLRRQVQHQADLIKRLRKSNYDDDDGDGGDRHGAVAGAVVTRISETVEASEEKARVAVEETARLAQRLAETERELQRMERRAATAAAATTSAAAAEGYRDESGAAGPGQSGMGLSLSSASRSGGGGVARLEEENRRLAEENDKLSRELQAFDLDFFEEIEDLKYKYSEAARKLRQYE